MKSKAVPSGTKHSKTLPTKLKTTELDAHILLNSASISKLYVEEKSTKPPGISKFTRKKLNEIATASTMFEASTTSKLINEKLNSSDICQQLLVSGYVQSYTDFYYLTHRNDPIISKPTPIIVSYQDLAYLRDNLVTAEVSRRNGNASGVYLPYNNLAEYYTTKSDWRTSIYFYQKFLEMTKLTSDKRSEMRALHSIGLVYQNMSEIAQAIQFHELHDQLAREYDVVEEVRKANIELYRVYNLHGEEYEKVKDFDNAYIFYQKCQNSAKSCWDKNAEGEACGKIGALLVQKGLYEDAIPYLQSFYLLAGDTGSTDGKCRASGSLATAFDALGRLEESMAELVKVQSMSEQDGNQLLQMQAYKAMGIMKTKLLQFQEAVELFEKHYALVKTILKQGLNNKLLAATPSHTRPTTAASRPGTANTNPSSRPGTATAKSPPVLSIPKTMRTNLPTHHDVELARTYVGISKGNLMLKIIIGDLFTNSQSHLMPLLEWKIYREDALPQDVGGEVKFHRRRNVKKPTDEDDDDNEDDAMYPAAQSPPPSRDAHDQ